MKELKPVTMIGNTFEEVKELYDKIIEFIDYDKSLINKIDEKFFIDPASSRYHNSLPHGLLFHSINTAIFMYRYLFFIRSNKMMDYMNELSDEEFQQYLKDGVFSGLFHDYCKVNTYVDEEDLTESQRGKIVYECSKHNIDSNDYLKNLGKKSGSDFIDNIIKGNIDKLDSIKKQYLWKDKFNVGHGEKSVIQLLRLGFNLTDHQIIGIRFHMMGLDSEWNTFRQEAFHEYLGSIPMLRTLYLADVTTGLLYE